MVSATTYVSSAVTSRIVSMSPSKSACRAGRMLPEPAWPCGACRQVLAESQKRAEAPVRVIVGGLSRIVVFSSVDDILPFIFDGSAIPVAE